MWEWGLASTSMRTMHDVMMIKNVKLKRMAGLANGFEEK